MVADKMHSRGEGPKQALVRQPDRIKQWWIKNW